MSDIKRDKEAISPEIKSPKHNKSTKECKWSYGIACCRKNPKTGTIEILTINKRVTYAFHMFVSGAYAANDDAIRQLFCQMTLAEKLDILSMNFYQMWYRVWLHSARNRQLFALSRIKFMSTFGSDAEGRQHLERLMRNTPNAETIWEIPKGRKSFSGENPINCAIRELYEETGIPRTAYRILGGSYTHTITDAGVVYHTVYFIAFTRRIIEPALRFVSLERFEEINDTRWMNVAAIRAIYADSPAIISHLNCYRQITNYVRSVIQNKSYTLRNRRRLDEKKAAQESAT
ncbi:MAG: NUDIX hydrolase [Methylomonas sp.]|jgi:8-oxo-dGTP pyrophosphatase MutT (NUDIX family)|uniref:NUDIX hydrolase n=1 Tax=Methylomonas sp. TaxID=418 RepID=UPI0025E55E9A|nr:NUDIX hydrolase [Methylomonas sp.]MCK9607537.1 NUDIX hydrolase [Methylomonas sp.]